MMKGMTIATAISKNGVLIRLTDERWQHITLSHKEIDPGDFQNIMMVIKYPDLILNGDAGEILAVKRKSGKKSWVVVAYKESSKDDGFVITTYITTNNKWLFQKEVLWTKQ